MDDDGDGLVDLNDLDCDCTNLIDLSLIPNPSFEDTLCCPFEESMLSCAESWVQASDGTSDLYNFCDFSELPFVGAVPPETPLPGGGDGFVGLYNFLAGYREYVGTCTTGPLLAGTTYSLNIHTAYAYGDADELNLHLYGSPVCGDLPWAGSTCPEGIGSWILLGTEIVEYEMDGSWVSVTITFTPFTNINAIAFGAPCGDIGDSDNSYFYFDELVLLETETMGYIEETGGWCSEDLLLTAVTDDPGGTWQWYKDGVALLGETTEFLEPFPYGEGEFTAVYTYFAGCKQIDYHSPEIPTADFAFENVCYAELVNFENLSFMSGGTVDTWIWDFGDDITSNLEDPSHLYTEPGLYFVELVVYSEDPSCNDTARAGITVFAKPEPDFQLNGIGVSYTGDWLACADQPIGFIDLTTIIGPVSFESWYWTFGDGNSSSDQNPTHTYTSNGEYEITLVVVSENGCVDSVKQRVYLNQVVAEFSTDSVCEGIPIQFLNGSYSSDGSLLTWNWNFGDDSDISNDENPVHLFEGSGLYEVELLVENAQGCRDSLSKNTFVFPNPEPRFYADNNPTDYFNTDLKMVMIYPNSHSSYLWEIPGGMPSLSTNYGSVDVVYPEFVRADYEVTLIETNEFGCVDSFTVVVQVLEDQMIYAPTAFTPNGDPFNQNWGVFVEGFNLDEFRLKLYNRWGELIWETNDPTNRWDGTYLNGVLVPDGTYVWHIKARDQINDEVFEYFGYVTVLK